MAEIKSREAHLKYGKLTSAADEDQIRSGVLVWVRQRVVSIILIGVMLLGCGLLAYHSFSDYWNSFHQSRAVQSYAEHVANMNREDYKQFIEDARAYNERLGQEGISWTLSEERRVEYNGLLNVDGRGIMGYITIPKINVLLPIYHGTEENTLQTSIGHLEQSSLPVGGESSHISMSGHRGLPSARLFTDLDKLREGDTFTITVLNETLTYEVDNIWIVEPNDVSHLTIEPGKDLCTLITCTPYGVNSHRLLVQAHRIENVNGDALVTADAIQIQPVFIAPFLSIPLLVVLLIYVLASTSAKRIKRRDYKAEYMKENSLDEVEIMPEDSDSIFEALSVRKGLK